MKTKFLISGDPHFKIDNVEETEIFINKVEELAKKECPDYIVILGDVLHTHERLHTIPMNLACSFIEKMRNITKTIVMVGNHDLISASQFLTENHWMNSLKNWNNVTIVDKVEYLKVDNLTFFFVPFVPNGRFVEALNTRSENWFGADCIFAHQEFFGCKMGAIISEVGDVWHEDNPLVISGHIHLKQKPQKNIFYTGSSMQNSFSESDGNIILIATFEEEKEPIFKEVDLELKQKKLIYLNMDQAENYIIKQDKKETIKLSVSGNYDEFKSFKKTEKYRELIDADIKIVFKPTRNEIKEDKNKDRKCENEINFLDILSKLVLDEKDEYLYSCHELIINGKIVDPKKILII